MLQALIPAGAFLAKYATPLLATGGALMGGKAAYEASGGDIGATALGAGAGAFGLPALKGVASKARQAASEGLSGLTGSSISAANRVLQARGIDPNTVSLAERARMGSNVSRVASVLPTAAGAAVLGGGALLVPRLAGAVGSGGKNLAVQYHKLLVLDVPQLIPMIQILGFLYTVLLLFLTICLDLQTYLNNRISLVHIRLISFIVASSVMLNWINLKTKVSILQI